MAKNQIGLKAIFLPLLQWSIHQSPCHVRSLGSITMQQGGQDMIAASSFVEIDELVHRTAAQGRARSTKEQFCDTIDCVD